MAEPFSFRIIFSFPQSRCAVERFLSPRSVALPFQQKPKRVKRPGILIVQCHRMAKGINSSVGIALRF